MVTVYVGLTHLFIRFVDYVYNIEYQQNDPLNSRTCLEHLSTKCSINYDFLVQNSYWMFVLFCCI